jgi:hypothetical protein
MPHGDGQFHAAIGHLEFTTAAQVKVSITYVHI